MELDRELVAGLMLLFLAGGACYGNQESQDGNGECVSVGGTSCLWRVLVAHHVQ